MKLIQFSLAILFFLLSLSVAKSEHGGGGNFISIAYSEDKNAKPNNTVELKAISSRAVVIYLGGGGGQFKWTANHTSSSYPMTKATMDLSKNNISVLVPDWPYSLLIQKGGFDMVCGMRCSKETQKRLLGIMEYAQKQYPNQPIWIVGHSNGSISIEYFAKYLKKLNRLPELKGAISSASRIETEINIPELRLAFLHHYNDNCQFTNRSVAETLFKRHKKWLGDNVTLTWVNGGYNGGIWDKKGPCIGGHHAYEGAYQEANSKLKNIILSEKLVK